MEEDFSDRLSRYRIEDQKREYQYIESKMKLTQHLDLSPLITDLFYKGNISKEDYVKWVLCEDLNFIPKLIK